MFWGAAAACGDCPGTVYRNPQLLIFDEATSALGGEKDFEIRQLIFPLKGKHTLVIVSHSPSTIADCDVVIQLNTEG